MLLVDLAAAGSMHVSFKSPPPIRDWRVGGGFRSAPSFGLQLHFKSDHLVFIHHNQHHHRSTRMSIPHAESHTLTRPRRR